MTRAGIQVHSRPTPIPAMIFVAGPVLEASAIDLHRLVFIFSIVLSDINKGD